jgi:hypothetical protein
MYRVALSGDSTGLSTGSLSWTGYHSLAGPWNASRTVGDSPRLTFGREQAGDAGVLTDADPQVADAGAGRQTLQPGRRH